MDSINVSELVERLGSDEDAVRKMAVFKLQSNIGDPSFADIFILEGGLSKLRNLALHTTGNTLAYSLTSFARLLEVDKGWDYVNQALVERVVQLVVTHPLVNILRGAMSILAHVVSRPYTAINPIPQPQSFGFRALKPAICIYPQFLEMLVSRLSSADHALCANSLQLINSLMREAIVGDIESDWPKFIRRLQDLGVIKAVYGLMQGSAVQDLSQSLLEFQALTKVLLRKWRDLPVDLDDPDHRRALKSIHALSNPSEKPSTPITMSDDNEVRRQHNHNPEKWRRLGFETETPASEFEHVGYLGMMDLADYVRRFEDGFQKQLLEQSTRPSEERCPIAGASLAVTSILYEHFDIEKAEVDDVKYHLAFESNTNFDKVFTPLILQWSILHVAGLQAFFRLWNATGALQKDFNKIFDLVRILLEVVLNEAVRTTQVQEIQAQIATYQLSTLRQVQMELIEKTHEEIWDVHLRSIKDELSYEALHFVKEQRIRCLLAGAWFSTGSGNRRATFRFAKLSTNRQYLHWADFDARSESDPDVEDMFDRVDLQYVTSVTSNVSTVPVSQNPSSAISSTSTLKKPASQPPATTTTTKITISGHASSATGGQTSRPNTPKPPIPNKHHGRSSASGAGPDLSSTSNNTATLLTLHPATQTLASEWLDGLLMLLNQAPITKETIKLIDLIESYGLKIRLLNVRFHEMSLSGGADVDGVDSGNRSSGPGMPMPSREGLDEDYWYDDFGG